MQKLIDNDFHNSKLTQPKVGMITQVFKYVYFTPRIPLEYPKIPFECPRIPQNTNNIKILKDFGLYYF
jgi:hypothetical protein